MLIGYNMYDIIMYGIYIFIKMNMMSDIVCMRI